MSETRYADAETLLLSLLAGDKARPRGMSDQEFSEWVAKRFAITKSALIYALQNVPGLAIVSLADILHRAFYATPNNDDDHKPRIVLGVPEYVVTDLTDTDPADRDLYLLVHVPNQALQRQQSSIVLPGENRSN